MVFREVTIQSKLFFFPKVSAVKIADGPTKTAVPISVHGAALTCGSMCSVSREPVTQVVLSKCYLHQLIN